MTQVPASTFNPNQPQKRRRTITSFIHPTFRPHAQSCSLLPTKNLVVPDGQELSTPIHPTVHFSGHRPSSRPSQRCNSGTEQVHLPASLARLLAARARWLGRMLRSPVAADTPNETGVDNGEATGDRRRGFGKAFGVLAGHEPVTDR